MKFDSIVVARIVFIVGILLSFSFTLYVGVWVLASRISLLPEPFVPGSLYYASLPYIPFVFLSAVGPLILIYAWFQFRRLGMRTRVVSIVIVIFLLSLIYDIGMAGLFNCARCKGTDAVIKANMSGLRSHAEAYFESKKSYKGVCSDTGFEPGYLEGVKRSLSSSSSKFTCYDSDSAWVATASLKTVTDMYWCVDSTGSSRQSSRSATGAESDCASLQVKP